jgi:hypothetical protein
MEHYLSNCDLQQIDTVEINVCVMCVYVLQSTFVDLKIKFQWRLLQIKGLFCWTDCILRSIQLTGFIDYGWVDR